MSIHRRSGNDASSATVSTWCSTPTIFPSLRTAAFDLAHYIGIPNLVTKRLRGEWVLHPLQTKPLEFVYRRYYDEALRKKAPTSSSAVRKHPGGAE